MLPPHLCPKLYTLLWVGAFPCPELERVYPGHNSVTTTCPNRLLQEWEHYRSYVTPRCSEQEIHVCLAAPQVALTNFFQPWTITAQDGRHPKWLATIGYDE